MMGLVFAIENVYEETPDSLKNLLDEIHSPHVRFCFDTGHYHAFSKRKVPLSNWIETLGSYLWEVHLHDNHTESDEHLPMGEGSFDFDQFFTLLSQFQLKPIFTIEPHQEDHLRRGMEAAKRYMNKHQIAERRIADRPRSPEFKERKKKTIERRLKRSAILNS